MEMSKHLEPVTWFDHLWAGVRAGPAGVIGFQL